MKKTIFAFLALALGPGCTTWRTSDAATLSALEFTTASSGAIARVQGTTGAAGAFRGYQLVTDWRPAATATVTEIAALFSEMIRTDLAVARRSKTDEEVVRLHSFCVFAPGYAVRLATDRGDREFLVCFQCDELRIFDDAGHFWERDFRAPSDVAGKLRALLDKS